MQSQLSKELEQICNAAALQDNTAVEPAEILQNIKLEPIEIKEEDTTQVRVVVVSSVEILLFLLSKERIYLLTFF